MATGNGLLQDGIIKRAGSQTPGWISNLGISYAAGVFTITDASGSTLHAENPGWITMPSTTVGRFVALKVTTAFSFQDDAHATSHMTNRGFGVTEAADWAEDRPFFLYAVNKANLDFTGADGASSFFISAVPHLTTSPSDMGDTAASASNDLQSSGMILDDVTPGDYASLPCRLIGAFRMRWSTTTDDWTVQTLAAGDGIGEQNLAMTFSKKWVMPLAQGGAVAGKYFADNGGTAPVFTTNLYFYYLDRDGRVRIEMHFTGDGGTDGSGAVQTIIGVPYKASTTASFVQYTGFLTVQVNAAIAGLGTLIFGSNSSTPTALAYLDVDAFDVVTLDQFTNATTRQITGQQTYMISTSL